MNASIHCANESVNNMDSNKEHRTMEHLAVKRVLNCTVHATGWHWLKVDKIFLKKNEYTFIEAHVLSLISR